MPLNLAKAKHITAKLDKLLIQRAQTLTLVFTPPAPSTTIQGIFRIGQTGADLQHVENADVVMLVLARDISLATLRTVSYVVPTTTTQLTLATLYVIVGIIPRGILANPDRFYCYCERGVFVTLLTRNADNSTTALFIPAVVLPIADADPSLGKEASDALMYLRYTDITLKQLRATIYVTIVDNTSPPGAAAAHDIAGRYLISAIGAERIPENVDRWAVTLERQR